MLQTFFKERWTNLFVSNSMCDQNLLLIIIKFDKPMQIPIYLFD